jgi:hypothetical protein
MVGVTVVLYGPSPDQVITTHGGLFAFPGLASGQSWGIQPSFDGPVNSAVTAFDAVVTLNAQIGFVTYGPEQFLAMDVNASHTLTAFDASLILRWRTGLISQLPVHTQCGNHFILTPFPETVPNQILTIARPWVPPCQQGRIDYMPLSGAAQDQNFLAVLFADANGSWQPATGGGASLKNVQPAARVRPGRTLRTRGGNLRVPLSVEGTEPWQAAEMVVRYDASRLRLRGVRRPGTAPSLLEYNARVPGVIRIALARREPSNGSESPLLLLFEASRASRGAPVEVVWSQVEGP